MLQIWAFRNPQEKHWWQIAEEVDLSMHEIQEMGAYRRREAIVKKVDSQAW
jgi:hypothetical protein